MRRPSGRLMRVLKFRFVIECFWPSWPPSRHRRQLSNAMAVGSSFLEIKPMMDFEKFHTRL